MRESSSDRVFTYINAGLLVVLSVLMIYPLYFILIAAISEPDAVSSGKVNFLPAGFTLDAFKNVFINNKIWIGYRNSIFYTVFGTIYNLALTIPAAYVLTKEMPFKKLLTWFFFLTMYFSGGMVPTYLLVKSLKLLNTPWVLIIGAGVNCWNLLVTRQFFRSSIPEELYEAAYVDGASEFRVFFRIALPLSGSIIAIMALFYGVNRWNAYYEAMIYITKQELFPLQLVLRSILMMNEQMIQMVSGELDDDAVSVLLQQAHMAAAMKYAVIFIASAPLIIAYPFVQKQFVRGVMIGSLKG